MYKKLDFLAEKLDGVLIYSNDHSNDQNSNFGYYTGLDAANIGGAFYYDFNKPLIITRDLHQAKRGIVKNVKLIKKTVLNDLKQQIRKGKIIGIDQDKITVSTFNELREKLSGRKLIDISKELSEIRAIKEKSEIEKIQKACKIADKLIDIAREMVKDKRTETEIAAETNYFLNKKGLVQAFEPIVAAGKNSVYIHYQPGKKKICKKEMVIVDAGAKFDRYCSDITRTFAINPNKKQKELYETVFDAQRFGIENCYAGIKAEEPYLLVNKRFGKRAKYFVHGLGHGLGLDVHEKPFLRKHSDYILKKNMIVTIEPGLYIPGIGGCRVEDTVVITKNKPRILTKSSYEWMV